MSTKKIQHKLNPRSIYSQGYKTHKQIMMWVPPSVEEEYFNDPSSPNIMELVYFIEASGIKRIDTSMYDGSFQHFYDMHIDIPKYNLAESSFCATTAEGGVGTSYIVESANSEYDSEKTATLISLDIQNDNIIDVYALITFRLIESEPDSIMIETLCGNRSLPPSGEGTRLINYLTDISYLIGINKVVLHPIDNAVGYYTRLNFIELTKDEADAINDDEGVVTFRRNTRARKNWKKAINAVRFAIHQNKLNEMKKNQIIIKKIYKAKYNEENMKKGIPINKPFSAPKKKFIPRLVGKIQNVEKNKMGDTIVDRVSYRITPGKSLKVAKMKSEIKDAALMTKLMRDNEKKVFNLSPVKEAQDEFSQSQIEREASQFQQEANKDAFNVLEKAKNVYQKETVPTTKSPVYEEMDVDVVVKKTRNTKTKTKMKPKKTTDKYQTESSTRKRKRIA